MRIGTIAGIFALGLALAPAARATVVSFSASGSGSDGPLAADAQFTTGAGFIDITLTNDLAASVIRSAGQALSDISFTLSNAPGTLGATTATGQQGNVSGAGLVTFTTGSPGRFLGVGGEGNFSIVGDTIVIEAIGGGKPSEMIAPAIANGGTYTNVNNGFQQFNPYTIGPAMFVLGLSGVTASTTVTAATFSFGTGPDTFVDGTPGTPGTFSAVPEPSTWAMMLLGFAGLGFAGYRKARNGRFAFSAG